MKYTSPDTAIPTRTPSWPRWHTHVCATPSATGEYKAVRIGAINDETQHMLDHFGFEPPEYIKVCARRCAIWTLTARRS